VNRSEWVVLCDFDGTAATIDTAELVLDRFATDDWRKTQGRFDGGEISLQQCLERQFSHIRGTKREMTAAVESVARLRPNFEAMVGYCGENGIPFVILSAGLDFVVTHMLQRAGVRDRVDLCIPGSVFTREGIRFEYPKLAYPVSRNFKEDKVLSYHGEGKRVIFIGDGTPDYPAAERADVVFSVKGSALSRMCISNSVHHFDFEDFSEVMTWMESTAALEEHHADNSGAA